MAFEKSRGLDLIPNYLPPSSYVDNVPDEIKARIENIGEVKRRIAVYWMLAIESELEKRSLISDPGVMVSIGFFDPAHEANEFGVIIRELIDFSPSPAGGRMRFVKVPSSIPVGDVSFPVIRRQATLSLHTNLHPDSGRGTCFAKKDGAKRLVTCEHVLAGKSDVNLYDDFGVHVERGDVMQLGGGGIDVGTVETTASFSNTALEVVDPIAPWSDIILDCSAGPLPGKVTAVSVTRGSLHPNVPARVFISVYGANGDSGSPVFEDSTVKPLVGLYMGEIITGAGISEGLCQNAAQATELLGLDLFER